MALESKGFNPTGRPTYLIELAMARRDWVVLGLLAAAMVLGWLRWQGYGVAHAGQATRRPRAATAVAPRHAPARHPT